MKIEWLFAIVIVFLASCQSSPDIETETVRVDRVVSGQTLEITDSQTGVIARVRLLGIQAPDMQQFPWGEAALQRLETLVLGATVRLETDIEPHDRFDRKLAYVWKNDTLINEILVKEGYVLAESYFPNVKYEKRLQLAQQEARLLDRQIWNPNAPLRETPAQFRR